MATGIVRYHPELQPYIMKDLVRTGRKLGHGAFGVVEELSGGGTFYACKKLHEAIVDTQDKAAMQWVSRFVSECKLLSDVRHPNIVQFMGLFFTDDSPFPFLVMEQLDTSLDHFLEERTQDIIIPMSLKLHILRDVAKGLIYLHGRNPPVIHRDLTACNILLNKSSMQAKIGDLGNAIIIDPIRLATTLTQMPGTYLYMPPEALGPNAVYDTSLDMFSFGHLFLYTIIQVFPDRLLPPVYYKTTSSSTGREIKARSEIERRSEYFNMLGKSQSEETQNKNVTQLIEQCLSNLPEDRPTACETMIVIEDLLGSLEDTYTKLVGRSTMELVNLVDSIEKNQDTHPRVAVIESNKIEQIKGGAPGVLKIYKVTGRIRKRVQWTECVFKITGTDPFLQYTRNDQVCDRIQLSSVTSVDELASTEDGKSDDEPAFGFTVHFSGRQSRSPWILRAHSNEERNSWMEAIQPGSAIQSQTNPVCSNYEDVDIIRPIVSHLIPTSETKQLESFLYTSKDQDQSTDAQSVKGKETLGSGIKVDFRPHPMSQESCHYENMECNPALLDRCLPSDSNTEISGNNDGSKETLTPEATKQEGKHDETNQAQIIVLMDQMQKMMEKLQNVYANTDELAAESSSESRTHPTNPHPPNAAPSEKTTNSNSEETEPISEYYDIVVVEDDNQTETFPPVQSSQLPEQFPVASPRKNKPASWTRTTLPRTGIRDNSADSKRGRTPPPVALKPKKQPQLPVLKPRTRFHSLGGSQDSPDITNSVKRLCSKASPLGGSVEQLILQHECTQAGQKPPVTPLQQFKCNSTPCSPKAMKRNLGIKPLPSPPITSRRVVTPASSDSLPGQTNSPKLEQKRPVPVPRPRKSLVEPKQKETISKLHRDESLTHMKSVRGDLINYADRMKIDKMLVSDQNDAGDPIYAVGAGRRPDWAKATTTIQSSATIIDETPLVDLQKEAVFIQPSAVQDLTAIGHGQYGQVYKATLRKGDGPKKTVAVKTIRKYTTQRDKEDFLKELNMMLRMIHPNIVQIFGLVQKDPPWMVMEYLQHGDLKNFLIVNKRPIEKLLQYMLDVAMGMHYIAEKGLVHRDLAARNVIVGEHEVCKVADFGLLREIPKDDTIYASMTAGGMFPIRWMAPESLQRREFSPASDVWSFGVLLWEMYHPKVTPYSDMRKSEVAKNVINGSLRLQPPADYPSVVQRIMKACGHSDPVKRPSFLLISTLLTSSAYGH